MDEEDLQLFTDVALIDQKLQIQSPSSAGAITSGRTLGEIIESSKLTEPIPSTSTSAEDAATKPSQLNAACQEILKNIEKALMDILKENRKEQATLIKYLNESTKSTDSSDSNMYRLIKCAGIPYFKDFSGYPQPRNEDVKEKIKNGELCCLDYLVSSRLWNKQDKECLKKAVMKNFADSGGNVEQLKELECKYSDRDSVIVGEDLKSIDVLNKQSIDWLKISATDFNGKYSASECESQWKLHLSPSVNKSKWTESETKNLMVIAKRHKFQNWDLIAADLGTRRTGYQCCIQYQSKNSLNEGKWSPEEDENLKKLVEKLSRPNYVPWNKVAWFFGTRSRKQCQERYLEHLRSNLRKGSFSPAEDKIIISGVQIFKDFGKIARFLPGRAPTQIRSRYYHLIGTNMSEFTKEEDELLVSLAKEHPRQWLKISESFTNRSKLECRKRYSALRKQKRTDEMTSALAEVWKEFNEMDGGLGGWEDELVARKPKRRGKAKVEAEKSAEYEEIVRYHETCSENYFGPRMRNPGSEEELEELSLNLRATMAMLSVTCDLSEKSDMIESLSQNSFFDSYDLKLLKKLAEEDKSKGTSPTENVTLKGALIPPNYNTLIGLNSVISNRRKMAQETWEAAGLPDMSHTRKQWEPDQRLLYSQAKALFRSRVQSLFFLPLVLCRIPTSEIAIPIFYRAKAKKYKTRSKKWIKNHAKNMCSQREKKRKLKEESEKAGEEGEEKAEAEENVGESRNKRKMDEDVEERKSVIMGGRRKRSRLDE